MGYIVAQENFQGGVDSRSEYAKLVTDASCYYTTGDSDIGVVGSQIIFQDSYIRLNSSDFKTDTPYYFHAKIKRLRTLQTFQIKLRNYDVYGKRIDETEQYIKLIRIREIPTVEEGHELTLDEKQVDVEFIFYPYAHFNSILFELGRNVSDLDGHGGRVPVIGYEEISEILDIKKSGGKPYLKIGIQSHPGLLTCINGEEIRLPKSGIQEIRDGIIFINFFSVVIAAKEDNDNLINQMSANPIPIESRVFLGEPKTRTIDRYIVDYIYKDNSGG